MYQSEADFEQEIRQKIVQIGSEMLNKGLVAGTWGNISARIPNTDKIAITPSGHAYNTLSASDIMIVDFNGNVLKGRFKPSSELPLHLAMYRKRIDIHSIVHTHSIYASACAVAHKSIPPIIEDLVQVAGGSIDVAEYALPGTEELGRNAIQALGNKQAVLLANHGVVACGMDLNSAMLLAELIEKAAKIYIFAAQIGGAKELSDQDVEMMNQFYIQHYRLRQEE